MPVPSLFIDFLSGSFNLILYASLFLCLALCLTFFKIPILFLQGLHTYIHPDDVNPPASGGVRAAIRRPGPNDAEIKPRKKLKQKFEFDENKAQIFRLKLNENQLQTRLYFKEFSRAFNLTVVAASCLLLHKFLSVSKGSGILASGAIIPILLGSFGVCRVLILIGYVSFERSASRRSEKQLSILLGILGFLLGLTIVFEILPQWVFDFRFQSLGGPGRFLVAAAMGFIAGFLYIPATSSARAFWLGTDQIRCDLSIISCGWIVRILLYANYLSIIFTSVLWINPFAELLVKKGVNIRTRSQSLSSFGEAEELVGNVGMLSSDFEKFRLWCLLGSGLLEFLTLRPKVQMYLNEAVLCWYQRLHASKVPDLDFSRAKVFLHNHFLCLVALQFLALPALVLLLLGLSQMNDSLFGNFESALSFLPLPCSALVKDVALFMAWWVVSVWTLFTSANLVLYRRGIHYVS